MGNLRVTAVLPTAVLLTALAGAACTAGADGSAAPADGIVLRVDAPEAAASGGLPPPPAIVVTDDGDVVIPAPPAYATDGELLPTLWTMTVTPNGIERLRAAADQPTAFSGRAADHYAELAKIAGSSELGPTNYFLPDEFLFVAVPADDPGDRPVVDWPEFASLPLAAASTCRRLPEAEVGEAFATAAADSLFADDGVLYEVAVVPVTPGAGC